MGQPFIHIRGAREHNLKNVDVDIPRDKFVVITGLSGSGKSSLAFDTIYAEGQRRYVESLSAYARQFLEMMEKPDVESIEGLTPTIAIEQRAGMHNPRSTVATTTEIYDYLRVLFARIGIPHCHICERVIESQSAEKIVNQMLQLPDGVRLNILAPLARGVKGEHRDVFAAARRDGFARLRVNGKIIATTEIKSLPKTFKHYIEAVVDRIVINANQRSRLTDSIELALKVGDGLLIANFPDESETGGRDQLFSEKYACPLHGSGLEELSPRVFSFNSPYGACPACDGLGVTMKMSALTEDNLRTISDIICSDCHGARLRPEALSVRVGGKNIREITQLTIEAALEFFRNLAVAGEKAIIAAPLLKEARERLGFLNNVGLNYLTLDRASGTLSGGEAQRIRLASQVGSKLVGVTYVLDEPTIGLHQRDNDRLMRALLELRDLGNTVVVVEHDERVITRADHLIDLGPGAGENGGEIVGQGAVADLLHAERSLTGKYLSHQLEIPPPKQRRPVASILSSGRDVICVRGARENNLKNLDIDIPLGRFVCVTGVSGSGKSSLINEVLFKNLARALHKNLARGGACDRVWSPSGKLDRIIDIDQSPIGRTPRSNPATYTGVFDEIRRLFAMLPEAKVRGYGPGRFSFNVKGGRCEDCQGQGQKLIEMHFLANVYVQCEQCKGRRFNRETLEVKYKNLSVADALDLSIDAALALFKNHPKIKDGLQTLHDVGLGYVKLGQSSATLSGGEAQRIKLAFELSRRTTAHTLYVLDEPTTGLHFHDIAKLLDVLHRLVDIGKSVIVIEHNLDVIKQADYVIDLGPEGGEAGGRLVAQGAPEEIAAAPQSFTGHYLKEILKSHPRMV